MPTRLALVPMLALLGLAPARAGEPDVPRWLSGELAASAGFDFRSGDYGESSDTEIAYAPFTLAYLFDHFLPTPYPGDQLELAVTVPFIAIDGLADVVGGADDAVVIGRGTERESDAGLGDVVLRATYLAYPRVESRLPAAELGVRLKLPTADEDERLGTGELDTTIQLDLYRRFGRLTPFATGGYRFLGSSSEIPLDDTPFASIGGDLRLTDALHAGLFYDWRDAASESSDDAHELFPYLALRLGEGLRLVPYAVVGLSDGSPDYGAGLQLKLTRSVR